MMVNNSTFAGPVLVLLTCLAMAPAAAAVENAPAPDKAAQVIVYDDAAIAQVQRTNIIYLVGIALGLAVLLFLYTRYRKLDHARAAVTLWPLWANALFLTIGIALSVPVAVWLSIDPTEAMFDRIPSYLRWPVAVGFVMAWPGLALFALRRVLPFGYRKELYVILGTIDIVLNVIAVLVLLGFNIGHEAKTPGTTVLFVSLVAVPLFVAIVGKAFFDHRRRKSAAHPNPPTA